MEVTLRRGTFADEPEDDRTAAILERGEREPCAHREHGTEVRDHPDVTDALRFVDQAIVERAIDAARHDLARTLQ